MRYIIRTMLQREWKSVPLWVLLPSNSNVIRENSDPARYLSFLLGGRTGRDGIGGATGSSKGTYYKVY